MKTSFDHSPTPLRFILLLVCLIGLTMLTACAETNTISSELEPVTLQLKWLHQFQTAGYYAALDQGFYEEAGLDVTILEGGPFNTYEAVLSGQAQYGVSNTEVLLRRLDGDPLVAIAAIFQHSPHAFMVRQDSGITNPHELIDRRVALDLDARTAELQAIFAAEGTPLNAVEFVDFTADSPDFYLDDSIDAFGIYATNEPFVWKQNDIPYTLIQAVNYGIDFYGDILYTTEQELADHPERLERFRAASLRGWAYAMDHPEEVVDLILTEYNSPKTREHLLFEAEMMRSYILPDLIEIGHMNPGRWQRIAETYESLGFIEPGYSLEGLVFDPDPPLDPTGFYLTIGIIGGLLLMTIGYSGALFNFNRRLQTAVDTRTADLQSSEAKMAALLANTPDAIWAVDDDYRLIFGNNLFQKEVQHSVGRKMEVGESAVPTTLPPEEKEAWLTYYGKALRGETIEFEWKRDVALEPEWINLRMGPILDQDGQPRSVVVIAHDVTEKRKTEEALRESEALHRITLENISDPIFITDDDGRFTYVSPSVEMALEYSPADVAEMGHISALLGPDLFDPAELAAQGELTSIETAVVTKSGEMKTFLVAVKQVNIQSGTTLYSCRDITRLKTQQDLLHKHKQIIAGTPDSISLVDSNYVYQVINPAYLRRTTKSREEIEGHSVIEIMGQDTFENVIKPEFDACLRGETIHYQSWFEYEGEGRRFMDVTYAPYENDAGDIKGVMVSARDLTDTRLAEERMREQMARFQAVWHASSDAMALSDENATVIDANPAYAELYGYSLEELIGQNFAIIFPEEVRDWANDEYQKTFANPVVPPLFESVVQRRDGTIREVESRVSFLEENGRRVAMLSTIRDITLRKETEVALQKATDNLEEAQRIGRIGSWEIDLRTGELYWSNEMYNILKRDMALGPPPMEAWLEFYHPAEREALLQKFQEATKRAGPYQQEHRHVLENGETLILYSEAESVVDENGEVVQLVGISQDITQRKMVEAAEMEQRNLARALMETAANLTRTLDVDEILERLLVVVKDAIPHDGAYVLLTDSAQTYVAAAKHCDCYAESELPLPASFRLAEIAALPHLQQMIAERQPLSIDDTAVFPGWSQLKRPLTRSYLGTPIQIKDQIIGFINLESTQPHAFGEIYYERLAALANWAAIALYNARLYEQQRELTRRITTIQETERRRLAYELHDDAGQALTALKIGLDLMRDSVDQAAPDLLSHFDDVLELTESTAVRIRQIAYGLRPPALDTIGVNATLDGLCREQEALTGLSIIYQGRELPKVPDAIGITLYRICQEALTNAARHAAATQVQVTLSQTGEQLTLTIVDNGRGFSLQPDPLDATTSPGLGLPAMRERAELLHGQLSVASEIGEGTIIKVSIPWSNTHD